MRLFGNITKNSKVENQDIEKKDFLNQVRNAHICSSHNRDNLQKVNKCGCFYCLKIFDPKLITDWCDDNTTAICPFCGIDSIIYENKSYPLNKKFLKGMKKEWF